MAETPVAPTNKSVTFRKKMEREMAWNNEGISNADKASGNPAGVKNTAPMKKSKPSKHARKTAKGAIKKGMISEKAAKRHLGDY
jgi:hypothetical protein